MPRHTPQHVSINPFILLQAIRDGRLNNDRDVENLFYGGFLHAREYHECKRAISGFKDLELIKVDENGDIELTSKFMKLLEAFDFSPSQMSLYGRDSLIVNPLFENPRPDAGNPEIFVLMPFSEDLQVIYENYIKRAADRCNRSIARADDFFNANPILSDIWNAINTASVIIADYTGKNPNVFYEIGIAHTLGKRVIPISQTTEDIPFDVAHRRAIIYEDSHSGLKQLEDELTSALDNETKRYDSVAAANEILDGNHLDMSTKGNRDQNKS